MGIKHTKTITVPDWTQADLDKAIAARQFPQGTTVNDIALNSDFNKDHIVDLTGIVQAGTNITTSGTGLNGDPFIINSTGGGVTNVSVTTANGVSGTVLNPTTTPAISLTLGAITPSSVASVGTVTGSNLSGTNTGDQTSVTGNAGTATRLATARNIAITGDLAYTTSFDGSTNVTGAGTLATVNPNIGSFGSASSVGGFTVNAKGLTTAASSIPIQIAESQVTSLVTDLAAKQPNITLTTTGTSGAATFSANTLNVPNYATANTYNINTTKIDQTPAGDTYGTLSGAVNGTNAVFTVSNGAYVSGSLAVELNGQMQTQGAGFDFVESGSGTFTFNIAPLTGSIIQASYITTASTNVTVGQAITVLSTTTVDGKTVANTPVYNVPAGKIAVITGYAVRVSAASGITNGATAGLGNISGTNNISASQAMNALLTTADVFQWAIFGMSKVTTGTVYYNQSAGATGTSQSLVIETMGYLS